MIELQEKQLVNIRNSSKGNQLKWSDGKLWYKADYLGYESLSEYMVAKLLKKTNIQEYVDYNLTTVSYNGNAYAGCASQSFLQKGEELITLEKLFRQCCGIELTRTLAGMEVEEKLQYVVNEVQNITQIAEFGKYLTQLLELDAVMLNEDRHMNNIAVIRSSFTGEYRCCPVFDNGAALFSDVRVDFGLHLSVEECLTKIEAKPFSKSFDEQMDAAESLYGQQFCFWFSDKDVEEYLEQVEGYDDTVKQRVLEVLRGQIRKYQYLKQKR